jgi:hypothetical protein
MTIAVVWQEGQELWAVADTRFSAPGVTTIAQRITDHGPKLFPLGVTVWEPGPRAFFDAIRLQTSIGYMYAGEVAPALATHALCAAVFQNLQTTDHRDPSLSEIVGFVKNTAARYMLNWGQRWPQHWKFTALIFGWCNINHRLEAYKLVPTLQSQISVNSECMDVSKPVAIGSGANEFDECLKSLRAGADASRPRLPLLAVERLVASETRDDVGGDIQLGRASSKGFQIMTRVHPEVPGRSKAMISFLGIDTLELGHVGTCRIGMTGLA